MKETLPLLWTVWMGFALGACAAADRAVAPTTEASRLREIPVETTQAYRARIRKGVSASGLDDNWTEFAVANPTDLGKTICEALVGNLLQVVKTSNLQARVVRPCQTEPLAPAQVQAGGSVLIAQSEIDSVALVLLMLARSGEFGKDLEAKRIDHTRFSSRAECQEMLSRMEARAEQDQAAAEKAGRTWLNEQVRIREQATKQACDERDQVTARCAALPGGEAEVKPACRTSTKSKRCVDAQKRLMKRGICGLEAERTTKSCDNAQGLLDLVRQRLNSKPEAQADQVPRMVCLDL